MWGYCTFNSQVILEFTSDTSDDHMQVTRESHVNWANNTLLSHVNDSCDISVRDASDGVFCSAAPTLVDVKVLKDEAAPTLAGAGTVKTLFSLTF